MASTATTDMTIKKLSHWISKSWVLNHNNMLQTTYKCTLVYDAHAVRIHSPENIILCYKERVEHQQLIFTPGSQGNIHCYPAHLEPN